MLAARPTATLVLTASRAIVVDSASLATWSPPQSVPFLLLRLDVLFVLLSGGLGRPFEPGSSFVPDGTTLFCPSAC